MSKYLIQASYTADGLKGVLAKGGSSRRKAVATMAEAMGGSLESFYFAFGDADVYAVADLPDDTSAAAVGMTVSASGAVHAKTVVLLTPEDVDEATKKSVPYSPPGS